MDFSDNIKEFLKVEFGSPDIESMSLEELKKFREKVVQKRQEYSMLELCRKLSGNAAYGASGNPFFPFFNIKLASDITGECRFLTKSMWNKLEYFFHETVWERKDLWEKFNFRLLEDKHDWYRTRHVSIYADTDSCYTTYGEFFDCMDEKWHNDYPDDRSKCEWILWFNKEFLDLQNTQWCNEIYAPRHAHSIHNFELETISVAGIYLSKKKYLKALVMGKGYNWYKTPKISGTGIDLIKSTTPRLCRDILKEMSSSLAFDYDEKDKAAYIAFFNSRMMEWKKKFMTAPIEDISESIGIGEYKKYVIEDQTSLVFALKAPKSVKAAARYNYLAHKNHEDNKRMVSGKMKYYNIRTGQKKDDIDFFGYPIGEIPEWAPKIDYGVQWLKTVVKPLNKFLEVMDIPQMTDTGVIQNSLFGF